MELVAKPTLLNSFLYLYFFNLENDLNRTKSGLEKIKFQSEESNTDEFLKKYFKKYISKNNTISKTDLDSILIEIDNKKHEVDIKKLFKFKIKSVFLPEQLSEKQKKKILSKKKSVYTNPDLYLEITDGKDIYFESLELKSTKNNNIPGSSVQQVAPFEWVIFIKRNEKKISVSTGFYINCITEKLPFPDRSPRPQIGFKTLRDWNQKHRKVEEKTLIIQNLSDKNKEKLKLLNDWQDYLAGEWMQIVTSGNTKKNEKWFNNAIRKFAVKFLDYSEKLSVKERKQLKQNLESLIK